MNTQKGFSTGWGIAILLLVAGSAYYFISQKIYTEDLPVPEEVIEKEDDAVASSSQKTVLKTEEVFQYATLYAAKFGTDVFLSNIFSSHGDVNSVSTYHIDTVRNTIRKLDTPYVYKKDGKLYGLKSYDIDYEMDYTKSTPYGEMVLNQQQLQKASDEIGVPVDQLSVKPFGDKPSMKVLAKTEYNPVTGQTRILKTDKTLEYTSCDMGTLGPCADGQFYFSIDGAKFPGSEYKIVGSLLDLEKTSREMFGIRFSYNLNTKDIKIEY